MYRDTLGEAAWVRHQISRLVGCAKGNKSPKGGLAHLDRLAHRVKIDGGHAFLLTFAIFPHMDQKVFCLE